MIARSWKPVSLALITAAVCGCSKSVTLENPTIPEPLVEQIPLAVAVRYPKEFEHYVHKEKVIGKDEWTIDMGRANGMLFTKLFGALFSDCTVIGERPKEAEESADETLPGHPVRCKFVPAGTNPHDLPIDALIEPSIDAFEFSVPNQSQTDSFAVWIRYRVKIFDAQGNEIANWPLSAYGKAMSSMMGGDDALRHAAVLAMRDAAALVILQMDKSTGISALAQARRSHAAGADAEGMLPVDDPLHTTATEDSHDDSG
ncbi:MAG TPA: hypothetical protein VF200_09815 [Woeseiaceae bacterium]